MHYLRAQIARISAGTVICPKGLLVENKIESEDEEKPAPTPESDLKYNEEFVDGINDQDVLNSENWMHLHAHLFSFGRCTKYKPPKQKKAGDEEEDEEKEEEEDEKAEKEVPLFQPVKDDASMKICTF